MFSTIFIMLSRYKNFWKIRNLIIRFKFWIESKFYYIKYRIRDKRENTSSYFELLRITLSGFLFSILCVVILVKVDPVFFPIYKYFDIKIPNGDEYVSFFATVSGIGGVFIGLYYAAISTVSASAYSQVANNIRALLLKERIGNVYMRYLSFVTFLSLIVIVVRILFQIYIGSALIVVIILSGIGIIAFVKLGQRAFYLFDPTTLSNTIFYEMKKYLQMVVLGGYKWGDQNFQSHAHKLVKQNIDTIETLSSIVKSSRHLAGQPYSELVKNLLGFLIFYQVQRNKIPNNSNWYEIMYVHKNWYLTDESTLNIAYNTGTQLNPDKEFDYYWIENKLLPIVYDCLKINLESNNRTIVFAILQYFEMFIETISKNGEIDKSIKFVSDLENFVFNINLEKYSKSKNIEESLNIIAFYELMVAMNIKIFLSFLKTFEIYNREEISYKLSKINWNHKKSIYKIGFPYFCSEHLQWLSERIDFELKVEGKVITPNWYQTEIISLHIYNKLSDNINLILDSMFNAIEKWKTNYSKKEMIIIHSAILSREWELFHKIQRGLFQLEKVAKNLFENRSIEGLNWENIDWEKIKITLEEKRSKILLEMAKKNIELSVENRPKEFPDYQGQFLHTLSESVIDAICQNNTDILKSIFRSFYYGCIIKFEDLKPIVKKVDWRVKQKFKMAIAPLLDLVDVSGYDYLMSEYYENTFIWEIIKNTWDEYLNTDTEQKLSVLSSAIVLTENSFEIEYRGIVRTNWQMKIERILELLPRKQSYRHEFYPRIPYEQVEHKSALVRLMARYRLSAMFDGIDIFSYFYFSTHPGKKNITFGRKSEQLKEAIDMEVKPDN